MQQGGSSGSPVFYVDKPEVVGMMSRSLLDYEYEDPKDPATRHLQNTNISVCVAAAQIAGALDTFRKLYPPRLDDIRPLAEHLETIPMKTSIGWQTFGPELS